MQKLMIACLAVSGICGLSVAANATPSDNITAVVSAHSDTAGTIADLPYTLAKLQGEIQTLQSDVKNLQTVDNKDPAGMHYYFSAQPAPNPDGSPIPTGG